MKPEVKDLISGIKAHLTDAEAAHDFTQPMAASVAASHMKNWQMITGPAQIKALLDHIEELEEQQKLWLEPSEEMVQAGLAEVQRMLDEWADEGSLSAYDVEELTDDMASDMAVFTLQAMAGAK